MKDVLKTESNVQPILAFEIEQKHGQGEDASVCLADPKSKAALIACLDGCGGSGAKKYPEAENWTGARIASFSSGRALAAWYRKNGLDLLGLQDYSAEAVKDSMTQALRESIDAVRDRISGGADRMIMSNMIRPFPTTLSCAIVDKLRCLYLWAGDSRGFILTKGGLTQTTTDDLKDKLDPFENIEQDGVLSNVISAKPFFVNVREITLSEPCLILTATDGCFSYFPTPMDFEGTILETLDETDSLAAWQTLLIERIGAVASDDYTMEVLAVGFDTFDEIKAYFRPTLKRYREEFAKKIRESKTREELRAVWDTYKLFYLRTQI